MIGFNKNFNISDLDEIILQMDKCTKVNGYLIFNIGSKIIDEIDTIEKRISTNFEIINKITYGNFKKRNILIAKFILFLQIYFNDLKKVLVKTFFIYVKKKNENNLQIYKNFFLQLSTFGCIINFPILSALSIVFTLSKLKFIKRKK